jgi:hypothetical protein
MQKWPVPGIVIFTFMNANTIMNNDDQAATKSEAPDLYMEQCFRSIDGPILEGWQRLPIALLKLGRILTAKEGERRDFSAAKITKLMDKHRNVVSSFGPMEIREYFWTHPHVEILGGGIRVEWFPTQDPHRRNDPPHVSISFYRVYRPEELVVKAAAMNMPDIEGSSEPVLPGEGRT